MDQNLSSKDVRERAGELFNLAVIDPRAALAGARELPLLDLGGGLTTEFVLAVICVEAGERLSSPEIISEGCSILERLAPLHEDVPDIIYNLANGLSGRARVHKYSDPRWYLETYADRVRSRRLFHEVALKGATDDLKGRALTNLGNGLWAAHRWVEAYDAYQRALQADSSNVVARTGAVRVLLRAHERGIGSSNMLLTVAARHLRQAKKDQGRLFELAGPDAERTLKPLLDAELRGGEMPDLSGADQYVQFVAHHRLALTLTIEGLDPTVRRWDSLTLPGIHEPIDSESGVPPLFAILNTLKADYLAARWLLFQALEEKAPESGSYGDTLDYARYGVNESLLMIAQRTSLDVLDKIALFVAEYFKLREDPRDLNFRTRFCRRINVPPGLEWHPSLDNEFAAGNRGLIALADAALDLCSEGFLHAHKQTRDVGTHRVGIIHDLTVTPSRESRYVTHYSVDEYQQTVIDTLRLVRACLIYLVDAADTREQRRTPTGLVGPMIVPDHDWIRRGEDPRECS